MSPRGTSNSNARGSAANRRARKAWLIENWRADVDEPKPEMNRPPRSAREAETWLHVQSVPLGWGLPACRCYRCGALLTLDTVTVDRIKPGIEGGTYARGNIRPACMRCNSITGTQLREARKAAA